MIDTPFGASDWQVDTFAAITGAYTLTFDGFNGHKFVLGVANSFSELVVTGQKDRYIITGNAAGAFGTGNVSTPNNGLATDRSTVIEINADDVMADTAKLSLFGAGWAGSSKGAYAGTFTILQMNANDTIAELWINGVQMPPGDYTGTADRTDWIGGTGTLSVVPISPKNPYPAFGVTVPGGDVELSWTNLDANVGSDVYVDVWFGTDPESDFEQVLTAGLNTTAVTASAPVADTYYWRVDSYLNGSATGEPNEGTVFTFIVSDTDNDGLPDEYELAHTDPPSRTALNPDDDLENGGAGDGLKNIEEFQIGTDPTNPDTDGDTLQDGEELTGVGLRPPTSPTEADTDFDRLSDGVETNTGAYVSVSDTGTDPTSTDSDGDGLNDGVETNTGTFISVLDTGTNPTVTDSDGDNAGDWYEVAATFTNPTDQGERPIIPYPLPDPDMNPVDTSKPVKVFILAGQSNMVGMGEIGGSKPGTLQTITKSEVNRSAATGQWYDRTGTAVRPYHGVYA